MSAAFTNLGGEMSLEEEFELAMSTPDDEVMEMDGVFSESCDDSPNEVSDYESVIGGAQGNIIDAAGPPLSTLEARNSESYSNVSLPSAGVSGKIIHDGGSVRLNSLIDTATNQVIIGEAQGVAPQPNNAHTESLRDAAQITVANGGMKTAGVQLYYNSSPNQPSISEKRRAFSMLSIAVPSTILRPIASQTAPTQSYYAAASASPGPSTFVGATDIAAMYQVKVQALPCSFCQNTFKNPGALASHQKACKMRPKSRDSGLEVVKKTRRSNQAKIQLQQLDTIQAQLDTIEAHKTDSERLRVQFDQAQAHISQLTGIIKEQTLQLKQLQDTNRLLVETIETRTRGSGL
jgi:hypothetical protein